MPYDTLIAIAKVLWTIGTSWFDIVSDILNGLIFINGSTKSITLPNCTTLNVSYTKAPTTDILPDASKNCTVVTEIQEQHLVWGFLSLSMVFVPGIFYVFSPGEISLCVRKTEQVAAY